VRSRSILLVAQLSPPTGMSAARRTAGLTKYLAKLGHRVTVLTSVASGEGPIEGAERVIRARDLMASRINWRRKHFKALSEGKGVTYAAGMSPVASVVVPDLALVGWTPFALPTALRLAARERPDCVITTSPPESAHLIGMALRRRGIPWIADLRDGWGYETTHPDWPLGVQHRLDRALEAAVVRRADQVTTVTEPITADIHERFGVDASTVPNGFDPDERIRARPEEVGLDPARHTIVHTGRMAVAARDPRPLIEALALLGERDPELAARAEAVFAGPLTEDELALIEASNGRARALGTLPREQTLKLQSAAGTLLLLTGRGRRSEATAKLYEYLAAGRPILVLGDESAAADIVRETGTGAAVPATDPEAIAAGLRRMIETAGSGSGNGGAERYSYVSIAEQMAAHVERLAG
jgi:glycosyltransferase involved in cell wall biosynthesis